MEDLKKDLNDFLTDGQAATTEVPTSASTNVTKIQGDKSIVERINKTIITEDGRQLLM